MTAAAACGLVGVRGGSKGRDKTYLKMDATSMMRGISNENPAEFLDRWMLYIWSEYEISGDSTRL